MVHTKTPLREVKQRSVFYLHDFSHNAAAFSRISGGLDVTKVIIRIACQFRMVCLVVTFGLATNFALAKQPPEVPVRLKGRIESCKVCHGINGNSIRDVTPSLAGQPKHYLKNQLVLIREAVREVSEMSYIIQDFTNEDLQALANYYSKLKPKQTGPAPNPVLVAKGNSVAKKLQCTSCHGGKLEGKGQIPRLAKQRVDYLYKSLKAFRNNKRPGANRTMASTIAKATDADLAALAHYVAAR